MDEKVKLRHVGETAMLGCDTMEGVKDYYESKWFESQPRKIPEWDASRVCPGLELAQAERKLAEAEMRLTNKRKELDDRRRDMDQQWEDLKTEEQMLRNSFIKFNGFIVENMQKRQRAEKKMEDELHLQETRLDEIMEVRQRVGTVRDVRMNMEESLDCHMIFREFVQGVADVSDKFQNIHDVLGHFAKVAETYRQCVERYKCNERIVLKTTLEYEEFVERCAKKMESLDIELQQCQASSENSKYEVRNARALYLYLKEMLDELDNEERQVRVMASKMYPLVPQKGAVPNKLPNADDIRSQLGFIRDGMLDMDTIIKLVILVLERDDPEKKKERERQREKEREKRRESKRQQQLAKHTSEEEISTPVAKKSASVSSTKSQQGKTTE